MSKKVVKPKQKLHKYVGTLEAYYETGMEGSHLIIVHDDRGINAQGFKSLDWAVSLADKFGYFAANIFDKDGNMVYTGTLTQDKRMVSQHDYRASFIPEEIDVKTWFLYLREEYRIELFTNIVVDPICKEYNMEFRVGEIVFDDLVSKDVVILNVTFGPNKTVGYWVNDKYLEGGRHPWELTKIDWADRWKKEVEKSRQEKKD